MPTKHMTAEQVVRDARLIVEGEIPIATCPVCVYAFEAQGISKAALRALVKKKTRNAEKTMCLVLGL